MSTITATLDNYITPIGLSPRLQRPSMALNRIWQPINLATVARALIMLWNDSAEIVEPVDYQCYDWSDWSRMVPKKSLVNHFVNHFHTNNRLPTRSTSTTLSAIEGTIE